MSKKQIVVGLLVFFLVPMLSGLYHALLGLHFDTILNAVLYDLPIMLEGVMIANYFHWVTKESDK